MKARILAAMKTKALYLFATAASIALVACTKEFEQEESVSPAQGEIITFTATAGGHTPDTRTVIENATAVYWSPADEIRIFYGTLTSGKFTSQNTSAAATAEFKGTFDTASGSINAGATSQDFWAVYPYDESAICDGNSLTVTVPATQEAVAGTFAPNLFPSVAKSSNLTLAFWNVCGGIKFTVSHNNICQVTFSSNGGEALAGTMKIGIDNNEHPYIINSISSHSSVTVTAPGGGVFKPGVEYFIVMFPTTSLTSPW